MNFDLGDDFRYAVRYVLQNSKVNLAFVSFYLLTYLDSGLFSSQTMVAAMIGTTFLNQDNPSQPLLLAEDAAEG